MPVIMNKPLIGFIGQGWIGKNYADDFEKRGYKVIRYSLEKPYRANKRAISGCDMVFIAVPTPTTLRRFDDRHIRSALSLVGKGKIAVIKSTLIMGSTQSLQTDYPHCLVLHSPEFLSERTAVYDAAHPDRNIVGASLKTRRHVAAAEKVLSILPIAPYNLVCSAEEAEFIKYSHNANGYVQVVFFNILYDICKARHMDWNRLRAAFAANPFMSHRYLDPYDKKGRGAGGNCFIKDFEAFIEFFRATMPDPIGLKVLEAIRDKNINLLVSTGKDVDLLKGVYGTVENVNKTARVPKKKK